MHEPAVAEYALKDIIGTDAMVAKEGVRLSAICGVDTVDEGDRRSCADYVPSGISSISDHCGVCRESRVPILRGASLDTVEDVASVPDSVVVHAAGEGFLSLELTERQ